MTNRLQIGRVVPGEILGRGAHQAVGGLRDARACGHTQKLQP